jgi:hypothetical protein
VSILVPTPVHAVPLELRREIVEELHPDVRWTDSVTGFVECPGAHLHTTDTTGEARFKIDGVPTISCFHQSCRSVIEEANRELRAKIGKVERGHGYQHVPTEADKQRWALTLELRRVEAKAAFDLHTIIEGTISAKELWECSPVKLTGREENDWWLLLQLFDPRDRIWIGEKHQSGQEWHRRNFRLVEDWLKLRRCPGPHICPSHFRPRSIHRSDENVVARRFVVAESDLLTHPQQVAVLLHLAKQLRLAAVVDSGNKSLHGWFRWPEAWTAEDARRFAAEGTS